MIPNIYVHVQSASINYLNVLIFVNIFGHQMQKPNTQGNENMPPQQSWDPSQVFPINTGGEPGFVPNLQYMQPPYQLDNYYPPPAQTPLDQHHHHQGPPYGRETGAGVSSPSLTPQQSIVNKVIFLCSFLLFLFPVFFSSSYKQKKE